MGLGDPFGDRKTKARAACCSRPGGIRPDKPVEDFCLQVPGNSGASIGHTEFDPLAGLDAVEFDAAAGFGVLDRVIEEDCTELAESMAIAFDLNWLRIDAQGDVVLGREGLHIAPELFSDGAERNRLARDGGFALVGPRKEEQVIDEFRHRFGFGSDRIDLVDVVGDGVVGMALE